MTRAVSVTYTVWRPAVDFLLAQKIQVSINTNCAMLTDEIARYLAEKQIGLFVSFPSCVPEEFDKIVDRRGAFEQVSNSLKLEGGCNCNCDFVRDNCTTD